MAGNSIINGGDIEAYGSSHSGTENADKGGSAGIGGGTSSGADNITINAGTVKARGSDIDGNNGGAGIGGGGRNPENSKVILTYSDPHQDMSVFATQFGRENANKVTLEKDFRDIESEELFEGNPDPMENSNVLNGKTIVPAESVLLSIPITVEMGEGHENLAKSWTEHLLGNYAAKAEAATVSLFYPKKTGSTATTVKAAQSSLADNLISYLADSTPAYYDNEESYLTIAQQTIDHYTSKQQVNNERDASTGVLAEGQKFYVLWEIPIRSIDLTLESPVCGEVTVTGGVQEPAPAVSTETENILLSDVWWLKEGETWDKYEGTITAGNTYRARITITPAFGYTLGWAYLSESNVKVNGVKPYILSKSSGRWEIIGSATAVHDWSEADYSWSDDNSSLTASSYCKGEPEITPEDSIELTVTATSEITKKPTCTEKGETTYTAIIDAEGFETQVKTLQNIDPLGHDWSEWTTVKEATETEQGLRRRVCRNDPTHIEEEIIPVHKVWHYIPPVTGIE